MQIYTFISTILVLAVIANSYFEIIAVYLPSRQYLIGAKLKPNHIMEEKKETTQKNNPLHGIKLADIVTYLEAVYGWEELGEQVNINCFLNEPSIKSSLKFLRKTPWARTKVENFYLYTKRQEKKGLL